MQHVALLMRISVKTCPFECSWQNLESSTEKPEKTSFKMGRFLKLVDTFKAKAELQESHRVWKDSFDIGKSMVSCDVCLKLLEFT